MPWAVKRGFIRRFREANGWTLAQASARIGVSARQIRAYESKNPPRAMQLATLNSLARGFGVQKTDIADWYDYGARYVRVALPQAVSDTQASVLPKVSTLSKRAQRERILGMDALTVRTPRGKLPLLGLSLFKLIWSRPIKYADQEFVVIGTVDDHQGLSLAVRKQLDARDGGKYRVVRWLEEGRTVFYTTVFACNSRDADTLTFASHENQAVGMVVRVVHRVPTDTWKGFHFFGDEKASFEFGFICEEILAAVPEIPKPADKTRKK